MKQKRNRKSLALLLAVVMLLSVLPLAGMAPDNTCTLSPDCTATVHQEGCPFFVADNTAAGSGDSPNGTEDLQAKQTQEPEQTQEP